MKKTILTVSLILVFSLIVPVAVLAKDTIYKDVGYDKWYSRAVFVMKDESVMQGDYFGFRPNDNITRAEFVTILSRLAKAETDVYVEAVFDDAPIDAWYGKVIAWAKENELVDGYSATLFGPDDPITREQMCVILANFIEKYSVSLPLGEEKTFADGDEISKWAKDAVAKCAKWGVVSGMEKNMFCPADTATRAQIAQLVYNMLLNADAENSGIEVPDQGGVDVSPPELHYTYYKSFDEFANYILNVTEKEIERITGLERLKYSFLDKTISDDEFKYGFFGSFIREKRENKAILYPCINGKEIALTGNKDYLSIDFHPTYSFKKPEITYNILGDEVRTVKVTYLDDKLCKQGEKQGASWLIKNLNENALNIHNYEKIKADRLEVGHDAYEHLEVYEKEFRLSDRTVKALVEDNSAREWTPYVMVTFVYEDALISIMFYKDVEEILSTFSFTKKSLV